MAITVIAPRIGLFIKFMIWSFLDIESRSLWEAFVM